MRGTWGITVGRRLGLVTAIASGALALGCAEGPRDEEAEQSPTGVDSPSSGASASASDSSPATASASGSSASTETEGGADSSTGDDEIKLDVGPIETTGNSGNPDGDMGCKKVDFLFVIDNSGSMGDEQDNLIASFPGFIDTIQNTLDEAQDYHIMVVDTDTWVYGGCDGLFCAPATQCLDAGGQCDLFAETSCLLACPVLSSACPGYACGSGPLECEDVLGAGVTHPRGPEASNRECNFVSGARYIDSNEADLVETFACAADVGTGSNSLDTEKPMEAMVEAVSPASGASTCNTGFVRDDAILVVTFITDEDDNNDSKGEVAGWRQALIAAKGGDENAVVVLGLFGDQDLEGGAICPPLDPDGNDGAEPSPRLRAFVDSWGERGFAGSVCADTYAPFFEEAVGIIDTTCEEFVPPAG